MPTITVTARNADTYQVTVEDGGSTSRHTVTCDDTAWKQFGGASASKEDLIQKSFTFLLQRESKESILSQFALPLIGRYFPEYQSVINT